MEGTRRWGRGDEGPTRTGPPHQEEKAAARGPLRVWSARAPSCSVGWDHERPRGEPEAALWGQGFRARPAPWVQGSGEALAVLPSLCSRAHAHAHAPHAHAPHALTRHRAPPPASPGCLVLGPVPSQPPPCPPPPRSRSPEPVMGKGRVASWGKTGEWGPRAQGSGFRALFTCVRLGTIGNEIVSFPRGHRNADTHSTHLP